VEKATKASWNLENMKLSTTTIHEVDQIPMSVSFQLLLFSLNIFLILLLLSISTLFKGFLVSTGYFF